jgi:hypothetical protein
VRAREDLVTAAAGAVNSAEAESIPLVRLLGLFVG